MATYEYKCKKCNRVFSMSGSFATLFAYKPKCPDCQSEDVQKLFSKPTIIFIGSGFYTNDKDKQNG